MAQLHKFNNSNLIRNEVKY